jgi:thiol-disulfide isomerase/thioredoxin
MPKTAQQGNVARQLIRMTARKTTGATRFRGEAEPKEERVWRMDGVNRRSCGLSRNGGCWGKAIAVNPSKQGAKIMQYLVGAILLFLAVVLMADFQQSTPLKLKYTAVDGRTVDLATMRGKVVLVDFWATWCPPCRGEVPNVVAAYKKYHDQGFEIVGVSLDKDKDKLLAFTEENGMVWPQYFDGQGWLNEVSRSFGIYSIPAMWLVGKDGKVITTNARGDLAGQVEKALKAP